MGMWDSISDFMSGGGKSAAEKGYNEYDEYMDPYRRGGREDYDRLRADNNRWGEGLGKFNDAGYSRYADINMSPGDYYKKLMSGYSESPMAKHEQGQALRASNAAGAASGMIGSGAMMKGLQENAADIAGRDQDRYFGHIMGTDQAQMGYLNNLQNQQSQQRQMQQYLTSLGYNASSGMGENAINRGNSNAKYNQSAFDDIMGLFGAGTRYFNGSGSSGQTKLPEYARKAMGM